MNTFGARQFFFFLLFFLSLAACKNQGEANISKDDNREVSPDALFYDYSMTAQDDQPDVAVRLQYRIKNKRGRPLILDSSNKVLLDTARMNLDSARFTGAYYEKILPLQGFAGRHLITFTDKQGKQNKTEFSFMPLSLAKELPEKIKRQTLEITLTNIANANGLVQLVLTDTAFFTNDINEEVQLNNGSLLITPQMWAEVSNGPINMEIYIEDEKLLKRNGKTNGRMET